VQNKKGEPDMNLVRRTATTLGGILLAVLLVAALAPKATRGVAAALVQVTNTASNAIPTEDGPGNFPFGGILCAEFNSRFCGTPAHLFLVPVTTSTGAAVKRLVIEDVSVGCEAPDPGSVVLTAVVDAPLPSDNETPDGAVGLRYFVPLTAIGGGNSFAQSPTRIYVDPGVQIGTELLGPIGNRGAGCNIYLTGHLETK
jgi:hypothetical protein